MRALLAERLDPKRFIHVLGVEGAAVCLADAWGLDPERAVLAALLHDYMKLDRSAESVSDLPTSGRYAATAEDIACPVVWHGLHAAKYSKERFGVEDQDVLDAVAWHTTGAKDFCQLGLLIYVADFLEPSRTFPGVSDARRELWNLPLEQAALGVARRKMAHVVGKGRELHSRTREMVEWLESIDSKQ